MNTITGKELAQALERKGFRLKTGGNHDLYYFVYEEKLTGLRIPISRGSKHNYSGSLLGRVLKEMHLDKKQFVDFVKCPMSEEKYIELLQEFNKLPLDPDDEAKK